MLPMNYFSKEPLPKVSDKYWVVYVDPTPEECELLETLGIDHEMVSICHSQSKHWVVAKAGLEAIDMFLNMIIGLM